MMKEEWVYSSKYVMEQSGLDYWYFNAFCELMEAIVPLGLHGACHSTSAILHMLLSEKGLPSLIKIGVVESPKGPFDHSWVESNDMIFDLAVAFPDKSGQYVGGPVFASIDVDAMQRFGNEYGVTGVNLGVDASEISEISLRDYIRNAYEKDQKGGVENPVTIWQMAECIFNICGIDVAADYLEEKYGDVRRVVAV
ncbi:lasso peptide biosynthesis protein [Pseudomonas sp. DP-17]|uniref:lasso peptide biosynthesis protein n=1 Tax=Pseudomonas sp. DP-17 TaxID=1580486 RepID=UPI001EFB1E5D|nr:lasso peptide biosynthesis protein [Pseudomonas sp. DP-17]MCG8911003.1 lasso peptide biosynthesis protein [Pseudomonas sp. DP-17]